VTDSATLREISAVIALAMDMGAIPRREFKAPDLPPGVVPRGVTPAIALDNAVTMNGWLNGQGAFCGLGFPGYTYLSELTQKSEYRAPSETTAEEMTRCWIEVTGASDAELKDLNHGMEEFQLQAAIYQMILTDGQFGRAQISVNLKNQMTDQRRKLPLIVDDANKAATVPKGSLLAFKPIEPIWTTPATYNSLDPTRDDFYVPTVWYVNGKQTHASRLLTYISHPLPDILKPAYNFSGMSMSQLIEPYVIRYLKTVDSVNRLISNFSTSGLATNLQATLADKGFEAGGADLFKRIAMFNQMRDNRGTMLVDKDTEEFFQFNVPLSGLSDLQAQAQEHMAAPAKLPLVKLTGITPSGLNASSEGEIKVLYDHIGARQQAVTPIVRTALRVLQCHLWGKVNPKIGFDWIALDSPTDKEKSEMRKADGDRDAAYVTNGIVDADEVRQRLRSDKTSGYVFITGPAPEPAMQTEHDLGEEGADNQASRDEDRADSDHQRSEASAAAAHKRQKELDKVAKDARPGEIAVPLRKLIVRKRDANGMIPVPATITPEDEVRYSHIRMGAASESNYQDDRMEGGRARTFDPTGKYPCGSCNKVIIVNGEPVRCAKVRVLEVYPDGIDIRRDSCRFWEDQAAGDPECDNPIYSVDEAGFARSPVADGWGCRICRYDLQMPKPDSQERTDWCGEHGMPIMRKACCNKNEPKD
jgi:phage-related protein (TIGR01555 family)